MMRIRVGSSKSRASLSFDEAVKLLEKFARETGFSFSVDELLNRCSVHTEGNDIEFIFNFKTNELERVRCLMAEPDDSVAAITASKFEISTGPGKSGTIEAVGPAGSLKIFVEDGRITSCHFATPKYEVTIETRGKREEEKYPEEEELW